MSRSLVYAHMTSSLAIPRREGLLGLPPERRRARPVAQKTNNCIRLKVYQVNAHMHSSCNLAMAQEQAQFDFRSF